MNLPTIITLFAVAAVFIVAMATRIINKKRGKSSCSCGCAGCALREACHKGRQASQ